MLVWIASEICMSPVIGESIFSVGAVADFELYCDRLLTGYLNVRFRMDFEAGERTGGKGVGAIPVLTVLRGSIKYLCYPLC